MKTQLFTLNRLAVFGDLIVYERGNWAKRERLPRYLVSRESDGRDLEQFRRLKSALRWAQAQPESSSPAPALPAKYSQGAGDQSQH